MTHISSPPDDAFRLSRDVAFSETDAAGYVHFSSIMRYIEDAEHATLKAHGLKVFDCDNLWPKVHIDVDFFTPLTFGTKVDIIVWLSRLGNTSLTWNFHIKEAYTGLLSASGQLVSVRIDKEGIKRPFSSAEKNALKRLEV